MDYISVNNNTQNYYQGKEKTINFSIDNLTLVASFKSEGYFYMLVNRYLNSDDINTKQVSTQNNFFQFSFMIKDKIFCQLDRPTNKIRLEFNPNKLNDDSYKELNFILSFLKDIHFTRLDLAIDLYNFDVSSYNIIDIGNRKKAYFYDRTGKLETFYSGSNKSSKYIRIYNKAVEQNLENIDWWRFELQLRDVYIEKYQTQLTSFYKDIYVFKYSVLDKYTIETNAMIEYLLHDMTRLNKLSKNIKTKYKNYIRELELLSISFFDDVIALTEERVNMYLRSICTKLELPQVLL